MAAGIVVGVSTGVMKPLLSKLSKLMGDEYKNLKGVPKEVMSLNEELTTMNAFLEKMEDAGELDPLAKDWKNRVREMAYDMEDCVDDFMLRVDAGGANVEGGILQKAARQLHKLRARHQIASKIQELKSRSLEASERRMRYKLDECVASSSNSVALDPRLTALYTESANLVGIDGPKEELLKLILDEKQHLRVVSIVGFGGLGKTTLANQGYRQIAGKFDCKAFASVSQQFDAIGLLRSILSQLDRQEAKESSCGLDVHDVINSLREYLQHKRYFIIIDDLWELPHWDVIRCMFPENNVRSRVIVTTRSQSVGVACCFLDEYVFKMEPLGQQDSRRLFLSRIFRCEDGCPFQYNDVLDEILKRCGGLPLAIITIASLLAVQQMRLKQEWEYVRNSLGSQFSTNPTLEGMKQILNLSYRHLPRHLRACFLYFGMYPEDHTIDRDDLVKQWVAEGFVSSLPGLFAEDVAESYFIELVNRSLILPVLDELGYKVFKCRVHDMMLDLIISKCREDNFVTLEDDSRPMAARRLCVISSDEDDKTTPVGVASLSQVRSLAVRGSNHVPSLGGSVHVPPLSEFKFLRVLLLQAWPCYSTPAGVKVVDLTGIRQLVHLRYLKVFLKWAWNHFVRLPNQIQGLRWLETLDIHDPVESIPSDIVLLTHLCHLRLTSSTRSLPLPDRIGIMKSLRTLEGFDLLHSSLDNIKSLGALSNLRCLALCSDNQRDGETVTVEAMRALRSSIQKLGNLKHLRLSSFTGIGSNVFSLSPSCYLEELCLSTLPQVPRWLMHLRNLCLLSIDADRMCRDDLHLIGKLPSLAILCLQVDAPEEKIVITHCAGFPHLRGLLLSGPKLSYLIFEAGAVPSLRIINIVL
ncbi:unnamed protein product [Urochloa humidicola]